MIIGLTGPNASGKGEAALYIKSKGFLYHSLSDILREEAKKRKIEPLRENLIKLGNELRGKFGPSYLAVRIKKELLKKEAHIVDSIRNPEEIAELRKLDSFVLIGVDAPVKLRYERGLRRKRPGDAETLEEFIKKEEKENKEEKNNQQLRKCLDMADMIIVNDSTLEEFHRKIYEAIEKNSKA